MPEVPKGMFYCIICDDNRPAEIVAYYTEIISFGEGILIEGLKSRYPVCNSHEKYAGKVVEA